jgi:YihY family inner membrane protein
MVTPAKLLKGLDEWQRGNRIAGFVYGVIKKFGDDRAGSLAALIAYYGFVSLFPLLLVAVTVLGYLLAGHRGLENQVLNSALGNFPVIGAKLHDSVHPLRGSPLGLIFGVLGLVWGSLGIAQAAQYAMAEVWGIPKVDRPSFVTRLARGVGFLSLLALSAVVTTTLASAATFGRAAMFAAVTGPILSTAANVGLYLAAFRILTPSEITLRELVPGAVLGGVGWEVLQLVGGYLVGHQLRHSSQVYGVFGLVLGLLSWIYLGAQLSLYAAELNVVRSRRLWPRGILTPPLTAADREALSR